MAKWRIKVYVQGDREPDVCDVDSSDVDAWAITVARLMKMHHTARIELSRVDTPFLADSWRVGIANAAEQYRRGLNLN